MITVSVAPSPATSGTTLGVSDANAALLPDVYPFWALIKAAGMMPTRSNGEIVKVTAGSSSGGTTTYTIVRAQGIPVTTARSIVVGDEMCEVHAAQREIGNDNYLKGLLINGKIVPSVASNNLTVAIKTLAGNDPSATEPVYCRIGDTIRSITAALSVTKNAGTNWFGSGAAETAAREIDYFVYLGYNSTDGITIGFSRIPFACEYEDFSTTTTDNRYAAISNISNAAAGDDYEVVGRFAATLSATSSFNWSVPTFNNKNLIQRPIYDSRWMVWAPTYTASGSMTISSTGLGTYKMSMESLNWRLVDGAISLGGSVSNQIFATIPFAPGSSNGGGYEGMGYGDIYNSGDFPPYILRNGGAVALMIMKYTMANYSSGACSIRLLGFYGLT